MNKTQEDLMKNFDLIFKRVNEPNFKLLSKQRSKLTFLINGIIDERNIPNGEWEGIEHLDMQISDKYNDINHFIDDIGKLYRNNYGNIKLTSNDKIRLKKLLEKANADIMSKEEEQIKLEELSKKKLIHSKEIIEQLKNKNQQINLIKSDDEIIAIENYEISAKAWMSAIEVHLETTENLRKFKKVKDFLNEKDMKLYLKLREYFQDKSKFDYPPM